MKPCPYGCGIVTNNGSMKRHILRTHEFVCSIEECIETIHKAKGLCFPHWRKQASLYAYGLTVEKYVEMFNSQDGKCKICNVDMFLTLRSESIATRSKVAHIDHDHLCCPTSKGCSMCIRGLLCGNCNVLLGHARENVDIMKSAIKYIETWRNDNT